MNSSASRVFAEFTLEEILGNYKVLLATLNDTYDGETDVI